MALLTRMEKRGVVPGPRAYSAAITAGQSGYRPGATLALLRSMQARGMRPANNVYSAAITACRNGARAQEAVALLKEIERPDIACYNAALLALLRPRSSRAYWRPSFAATQR